MPNKQFYSLLLALIALNVTNIDFKGKLEETRRKVGTVESFLEKKFKSSFTKHKNG